MSEDAQTKTTEAFPQNDWHPIATAPQGEHVMVRGPGLTECQSFWGKVSHVPIYGWLDFSKDDPEDVDRLKPQPSEWRFLVEEVDL